VRDEDVARANVRVTTSIVVFFSSWGSSWQARVIFFPFFTSISCTPFLQDQNGSSKRSVVDSCPREGFLPGQDPALLWLIFDLGSSFFGIHAAAVRP